MIDEQGNYVPVAQPTTTIAPTITAPTAADVYSSDNIAAAVTQPAAKLDLSDTSSIYDYYLKGADVTALQSKYQADQAALAKAKATAQSRQLAIEQNPLEGMSYIVGAQSRAGQLDSAQIQALADATGVSHSAYLAAKETATQKANLAISQHDQLTSLIVNNPGAKIKYTDTVEEAAKKIEKYGEEKSKDAEKKALKEQARALGLKTSGSRKELEKRIQKAVKASKEKEAILEDLKIAQAKKDLSKTGSGDKAKTSYTDIELKLLTNELFDEAIANGMYGNYTYEYVKQQADSLGLDTETGSVVDNTIRAKFGMGSQTKEK